MAAPTRTIRGSASNRTRRSSTTELTPHSAPLKCRREAYELLAAHVPFLERPRALLNAAVAISLHELEDLEPGYVERRLQGIADRILARCGRGSDRALLAHAHEVLFDEEGLRGDDRNDYRSQSSYVSRVLETQRGLPITLCLIYKNVLERLGFEVFGVNAPGHFLAAIEMDGSMTLVDPFFGGLPLTESEAIRRIETSAEVKIPRGERLLKPATHRQWITRMLGNLEHIFYHRQERENLAAMLELRGLLPR
ncbi:MAG: transglutaminase family protein [Planctomycetes bacterium]|nr:transglutaminase family protein [Planctomycetota bacterium]